jgi:hypothetical protein
VKGKRGIETTGSEPERALRDGGGNGLGGVRRVRGAEETQLRRQHHGARSPLRASVG